MCVRMFVCSYVCVCVCVCVTCMYVQYVCWCASVFVNNPLGSLFRYRPWSHDSHVIHPSAPCVR